MTQQERKFKLKPEFSKPFDTKTLQIRRHLKLDFGVCSWRVCNIPLSFTMLFVYE